MTIEMSHEDAKTINKNKEPIIYLQNKKIQFLLFNPNQKQKRAVTTANKNKQKFNSNI